MEFPDAITTVAAICAHNACKGIAKLGGLILGGQFRHKEYRDALMKAQADRDVEDIKAGNARFDANILHQALALPDMPLNVPLEYLPMLEGQRQESSNLNENIGVALSILAETPEEDISDEPVSPDWFARWRREAQIIGDQELRNLWGRILAEEVKQPNSVSLKTLDVLKNVTAEDAELFCHTVKFRIGSLIVSSYASSITPYSIEQLIQLQGLGLITGGDLSPVPQAVDETDRRIINCQGFFLSFDLPNKSSLGWGIYGYSLSPAGFEILNISDSIPEPDLATIKIVGDHVWKYTPDTCQVMEARSWSDQAKILHSWHR